MKFQFLGTAADTCAPVGNSALAYDCQILSYKHLWGYYYVKVIFFPWPGKTCNFRLLQKKYRSLLPCFFYGRNLLFTAYITCTAYSAFRPSRKCPMVCNYFKHITRTVSCFPHLQYTVAFTWTMDSSGSKQLLLRINIRTSCRYVISVS